ncbi:MAG: VCBS repeat-containing protein [Muricauda sp.]|nr:VCBS repeat-containing protein [Allomuricauda sp.]MBA4745706.1 VCBS repeat-containing protein [Allomuricauda sp.]
MDVKGLLIKIEARLLVLMVLLALCCLGISCVEKKKEKRPLFESMSMEETGLFFENTLNYTNEFNIYKYRNYYNGGGVGLGDVNNDGLLDVYMTANLLPNKLFLNRGNFQFEDVTESAGVSGMRAWSTGVSMVDINSDGWLDIYVCNSGGIKGDNKQNEFFINNRDGTFTDMAEELGLADQGLSTHAAFFDFDGDGDLDVYILNNSYRSIRSFDLEANERKVHNKLGGDKLLRNDGMVFKNVTEEAGIYSSEIGFGLGISVSDLNRDGWPDLYISNDFFEKDYIYMNNGDGTFSENLEEQMRSISMGSMGSDIADISGDGYPEIFVTEMLPESDGRLKTTMVFENWDQYQNNLKNGYYHQYTRNMLHQHNGKTDGQITFSEIGRLVGIEATDWSWSPLISDFNYDGYNDIFISNGLVKDLLNRDYTNYVVSEEVAKMVEKKSGVDYKHLVDLMPPNKISNYMYSGGPDLSFTNTAKEWGLAEPSHSNGAAYGDLDNDGDLDLIVNNANMPLFVYKNTTVEQHPEAHYLKIKLLGAQKNRQAIGTKVTLKANGKLFYKEQFLNRGFQSTIDPTLNFGLGPIQKIDSVIIDWPYGGTTYLTDVQSNQTLTVDEQTIQKINPSPFLSGNDSKLFQKLKSTEVMDFIHMENAFVDFDYDRLLYHFKSTQGPKIAEADVNNDGLQDVFIGGAKGTAGSLFIQQSNGAFMKTNMALFEEDKESEDLGCTFFDANNDGDLDLYVTSGGIEFTGNSFALVDRLYFNDGKGNFEKSKQLLPNAKPESTSSVVSADYDGDGDLDLFVGVRLKIKNYGVPQSSYLLENDGTGNFTDVTSQNASALLNLGLVTDAKWVDFDNDGDQDLLVVGKWMPITLLENRNGVLEPAQIGPFKDTTGWWNTCQVTDLNNDGYPDFVLGNHGLNSRFKASADKPLYCYINDFDGNGDVEQIICKYIGDKAYVTPMRQDIVQQMPYLFKKYNSYESYKEQTIEQVFSAEELKGAIVHETKMLESVVVLSNGNGGFTIKPLPKEAQISPTFAVLLDDFNDDGSIDVMLGGNLFGVKPEVGRYDASYGTVLLNNGKGNFEVAGTKESGINMEGEIRDIKKLEVVGKELIIVARNNDSLEVYRKN